ncbi:MAG: hypothetical protein IT424_11575 [Pirellulales bacterium]|nr:hypothetical protein [Pirellulales bacterium]
MPPFRQRPLTWLFLAALACAALAVRARHSQSAWLDVLWLGQLYIVAGWAALSGAHRLARAGVVIAWILGAALGAADLRQTTPDLRYILGSLTLLTGVSFGLTWLLKRLARSLSTPDDLPPAGRWQFPLAESFGWTIVVAVAAAVLPHAAFAHLWEVSELLPQLALSGAAALIMTLFLVPQPRRDRAGLVAAAIASAGLFALLPRITPAFNAASQQVAAGALAVVALWTLVQRLDEQAAASPSINGGDGQPDRRAA